MKYLISVILLAFLCVSTSAAINTTITDKGVYKSLDFQIKSLKAGSFLYLFVESDKADSRQVLGFFTTTSDGLLHLIFSSEHVKFKASDGVLNAGGFSRLEDGVYPINMQVADPRVFGCYFFIFSADNLTIPKITTEKTGSCGASRVDSKICFRYKDYWKNNSIPSGKVFVPSLGNFTEDREVIKNSLFISGIESEYVAYQLSLLDNKDILAFHSVLSDYNFDSPTGDVLGMRVYNYTTIADFDMLLYKFFTESGRYSRDYKIIHFKLSELNKPVCGEL